MTGEEALALAASHGVRATLALGDLHLEAEHKPPDQVLVALRDHKQIVVTELRKWRRIFDRQVATIMRKRGLPQLEAERAAYDIVLIERLNATHPDTDPSRCAHCGQTETQSNILPPIGVGDRHTWLHSGCWAPWRDRRRAEAVEQLAVMGIACATVRAVRENLCWHFLQGVRASYRH
jgi:hypothetical protein